MQNPHMRSAATRVADSVIITLTGWIAIKWSIYDFSAVSSNPALFTIASVAAGLLAYIVFPVMEVYKSWRGTPFSSMLLRTTLAWFLVCFTVVAGLFFLVGGASISRRWLSSWLVYALIALWIFRLVINSVLKAARRKGFNQKVVLLAGYGALGRLIHRRTRLYPDIGFHVKYILDGEIVTLPNIEDVELIKTFDQLEEIVRSQKVEEIWLTLPLSEQSQIREVMKRLRNDLVKIRWLPDLFALHILNHKFEDFMGLTAVHLNAAPSPGIHGWLKQCFDRVFAAAALMCLSPVFIAIACAVKISSPGPIFFRQPRQGQGGRQFMIYKFRTMKVHDESGAVTQAKKGDARITRIGAILRKTSLDELPQFINVLLGDMSVVGPRPHAVEHNRIYSDRIEGYMLRHLVKPGITGWAQINGWRGETDTLEKMERRVECDIFYIKNWSFLLDIKIIWRTAFKGWTNSNAY